MGNEIYICPVCKDAYSGAPNAYDSVCPTCKSVLVPTFISSDKWHYMTKEQKEEVKNDAANPLKLGMTDANSIIVTTCDIAKPYEIIGPVYFQVSNKGILSSTLDMLRKKYTSKLAQMKRNNMMSPTHSDWGFICGEWYVGQNDFDTAFYISVEELKIRAKALGADAIIGMKQDIDIDSNGFSYFYLQMYGTAVKFK